MWNAPAEDEAVVPIPEQAQQQEQQLALQEGGQDPGEEEEEEEGDDDDDDEEEGEQEGSQEVPAVQQQLEELLVAMQVKNLTHRSQYQLQVSISIFVVKSLYCVWPHRSSHYNHAV